MRDVREFYLARLPWLTCVIEKHRNAMDELKPKGIMIDGNRADTQITENGIHYALDLQLNKDASFYMDTRNLRQWITGAYTRKDRPQYFCLPGSLGIAALGGGAAFVAQVDMNRNHLGLAHKSRALNGFDAAKMKLMPVDFFAAVGSLKREKALFDMVILDPPFFSTTERGRVNQAGESTRLINKARPLVADGGYLIIINNALFYSGQAFMAELEVLCQGGFLSLEDLSLCRRMSLAIRPPPPPLFRLTVTVQPPYEDCHPKGEAQRLILFILFELYLPTYSILQPCGSGSQ